MAYKHIQIEHEQSSKRAGEPCGDVIAFDRTPTSTVAVLSDGLGSGIKANLAANWCTARILELIRTGASVREAFTSAVHTMNAARGTGMPYAVFTVIQVLPDGTTSALSYEIPPPILATPYTASTLDQKRFVRDQAVVFEANCVLDPGDGIIAVSDGITQAGLGAGLAEGWGIEGVCAFAKDLLSSGILVSELPRHIHRQARDYWLQRPNATPAKQGDDCTVLLARCREGNVVNLMTGPAADPSQDRTMVHAFLASEGPKVVCGATTARIVARHFGRKLDVEQNEESLIAPPQYRIEGIDLVTEGAVTLNQAYNILDDDPADYAEESGVTHLCRLLRNADRVNFVLGRAPNMAEGDISFRQQGILNRSKIVALLAERLRSAGKLVATEHW